MLTNILLGLIAVLLVLIWTSITIGSNNLAQINEKLTSFNNYILRKGE